MVILPDNHDPLMPGSPYTRASLGANVHVLSVPPRSRATWQVALAHGHQTRGPADFRHAYPISPAEIARSGRDYVALGHWDMPFDASSGPVTAAYSGSPSRVGTCALTTLRLVPDGSRRVSVEQLTMT